MILAPNNEYCVALDACVLMPMPLCDTLLRSAEEPSLFRIAWSDLIMGEVKKGLRGNKFGYTEEQVQRRIHKMNEAFPEALYFVPEGLISGVTGLPDPDDRHVVALALIAQANTIVTDNARHFPCEALSKYNLTALTSDEFLVHQFHLDPGVMLEKIDRQAAGIRRRREDILSLLKISAPSFCQLCLQRDLR